MKRSKLMLKILNFLYTTKEPVRQSHIARDAYGIATADAINRTVRTDVSRTLRQLIEENLVDVPIHMKYRYVISRYGSYLLDGMRRAKRRKYVSS